MARLHVLHLFPDSSAHPYGRKEGQYMQCDVLLDASDATLATQ